MGAANSAQVIALELEKVDDVVPKLVDSDAMFFGNIEKRPADVISFRDMRVPLELRPGGKFKYFDSDGGDMGRGGAPTYDKAVISGAQMALALEWTKKAEWGTDDRRKSVLNVFRRLLANSMGEFRRHIEGQCMTGGDGVLATITSVSTAGSKDTYTCTTDGFGVKLLRFDQNVRIFNSTLSTDRTAGGEVTIDLYDLANKQVRVGVNVSGSTGGDKIVASGLSTTPPVGLFGVPYHHNDSSSGSWLGFSRSTTPEIRANRVTASGTLALAFARLAINKIGDRVGYDSMQRPTAWMHPCQKQAYEELGQLASIINKTTADDGLNLYFGDNMQIAGSPIKCSYLWDKTRIDFIVNQVWGRAVTHEAGFYDVDGRRIWEVRGATGGIATSQLFYLAVVFNLFVNNPAACSYISDLTVPAGY